MFLAFVQKFASSWSIHRVGNCIPNLLRQLLIRKLYKGVSTPNVQELCCLRTIKAEENLFAHKTHPRKTSTGCLQTREFDGECRIIKPLSTHFYGEIQVACRRCHSITVSTTWSTLKESGALDYSCPLSKRSSSRAREL